MQTTFAAAIAESIRTNSRVSASLSASQAKELLAVCDDYALDGGKYYVRGTSFGREWTLCVTVEGGCIQPANLQDARMVDGWFVATMWN